jgi:hypothetical protein
MKSLVCCVAGILNRMTDPIVNFRVPEGMLFFPFCPLSRKEKEIKKLCALSDSNERSEWVVKKTKESNSLDIDFMVKIGGKICILKK